MSLNKRKTNNTSNLDTYGEPFALDITYSSTLGPSIKRDKEPLWLNVLTEF
jgi:hypothetical protein